MSSVMGFKNILFATTYQFLSKSLRYSCLRHIVDGIWHMLYYMRMHISSAWEIIFWTWYRLKNKSRHTDDPLMIPKPRPSATKNIFAQNIVNQNILKIWVRFWVQKNVIVLYKLTICNIFPRLSMGQPLTMDSQSHSAKGITKQCHELSQIP